MDHCVVLHRARLSLRMLHVRNILRYKTTSNLELQIYTLLLYSVN